MKSIKQEYKNLVEILADAMLIYKFCKILDLAHKACYAIVLKGLISSRAVTYHGLFLLMITIITTASF